MTKHIERQIKPTNADPERTHLNRELIKFPEGVNTRTEAVEHRIKNAGLKRKVSKNQVQAIRVLLTGSHKRMLELEKEGKLDAWCQKNVEWLGETFGKDNVVSAVLHMDEVTPHIHATVVPITEAKRVRRKKEELVQKRYRKKGEGPRLCVNDVMSRANLKSYQTKYAAYMEEFGLERGIEGSKAKHRSTREYYKDMLLLSEDLKEDVRQLQSQDAEAKKKLEETNAKLEKEKLEKNVTAVKNKIVGAVSTLIPTTETQRLRDENALLEMELQKSRNRVSSLTKELTQLKDTFWDEVHSQMKKFQEKENRAYERFKQEMKYEYELKMTDLRMSMKGLTDRITAVAKEFPKIGETLSLFKQCRDLGISEKLSFEMIKEGKSCMLTKDIYSKEHKRSFGAFGMEARIGLDERTGKKCVLIDGKNKGDWIKHQQVHQIHQQKKGLSIFRS